MMRPVEPLSLGLCKEVDGARPTKWVKDASGNGIFKRRCGSHTEMYIGELDTNKRRKGDGSCVWVRTTDYLDDTERSLEEVRLGKHAVLPSVITRSSYDGQWLDDRMHGEGTWCCSEGGRYVGEWSKGMRHGKGTMIYVDGAVYEGEWSLDKKEGKGFMTFPENDDGSVAMLEGTWVSDEFVIADESQ